MDGLLSNANAREKQIASLRSIGKPFEPLRFAERAAAAIGEQVRAVEK